MTARDTLAAAISARLGAAREIAYDVHSWWSATFEGDRHVFRFALADRSDLDARARLLRDDDIPLHKGFVADIAVSSIDPAHSGEIIVEALVIQA